jgi:glycosyltransferase involved in cell wall biosynthesis
MRIAVNTRLLIKNKLEGIGWFTYETLKRITRMHPEHEFIFIFDRKYDPSFIFSDNITPVVVHPPARHPILYIIWFEFRIPLFLERIQADLFLSPDGYLSLHSNVPSISVIHDLNFEHYPKHIPFLDRLHYQHFFKRYARKAKRIATVSQYTKQDIINTYETEADKIDVVYNGANEIYKPLEDHEKQTIRKTYTNGDPYFIYIGSLHTRKNIPHLLEGFELFKQSSGSSYKLLIVGEKMWKNYDLNSYYQKMRHKEDVLFLGRKTTEELSGLLGSAEALTLVSYFEGFGIPALEAMYAGVPIIVSNVTALPEICREAALFADPYSSDSIKEAMNKIKDDPALKQQLIDKGQERKQLFTWEKTAQNVWDSIEKALYSDSK